MSKDNIKKANGVFIAYFVHTGHLTKEEAKEMAGMDDSHFEEAYAKAGNMFAKIGNENAVSTKVFDHLAKEVEDYMKKISGYGIA